MTKGNRRAAVLGSPIEHSLSPVLHRAAYAALGLESWAYDRYEVTEENFARFVSGCGTEWAGLSLTMPLKQVALQVVDVVEPLAEVVGAVNTLLFSPGGLKVGANTDVYGIVEAVTQARAGAAETPRTGVIVGGGATAASAVAALGQLGITTPVILVRSLGRAGTVIRAATAMGVTPRYLTLGSAEAAEAIQRAEVLISTIPGGASDQLCEVLPQELTASQTVLDVIYDGWPTALPRTWAERGGTVAPGYDMLLYQAAEQVRLMTGQPAPVEAMRTALLSALNLA